MARRQNIERRRKQVLQYRKRRQLRSPFRRAASYFWATIVVSAIMLFCVCVTMVIGGQDDWATLPTTPGRRMLRVVHASARSRATIERMGNVRRQARALQDSDIGISLALAVPSYQEIEVENKWSVPLNQVSSVSPLEPLTLFPKEEYATKKSISPVRLYVAYALRQAGFHPRVPKELKGRGVAVFQVALDVSGVPVSVVRVEPLGEETPSLRLARLAIVQARGKTVAEGCIRMEWNMEDTP